MLVWYDLYQVERYALTFVWCDGHHSLTVLKPSVVAGLLAFCASLLLAEVTTLFWAVGYSWQRDDG